MADDEHVEENETTIKPEETQVKEDEVDEDMGEATTEGTKKKRKRKKKKKGV